MQSHDFIRVFFNTGSGVTARTFNSRKCDILVNLSCWKWKCIGLWDTAYLVCSIVYGMF